MLKIHWQDTITYLTNSKNLPVGMVGLGLNM